MPAQIQKGTTYADFPAANSQVTANNLNNHVDNAVLLSGAISEQATGTPEEADYILAERAGALFKYTIESVKTLLSSIFVPLTGGTMTGPLLLNTSNPSTSATAASKGYVDATVGGSILPGQIVMWGTSTVPAGWLECNGQSTAGYPNLTALFGTNLPDLRGEFVRGWDGIPARNVDPGREIRSAQAQSVQAHTHSYTLTAATSTSFAGGNSTGLVPTQSSSTTGSTGTAETRPRNVALMFIVKT